MGADGDTNVNLVLSVFPGIDLLGRAFEEEGYCVVRGPDLLWGGDIRTFHPPAGVFEGVIGGPPCQDFWGGMANLSRMAQSQGKASRFGNLIPEYERVVVEAVPDWWVMENVMGAPLPKLPGCEAMALNNRWLGERQNRLRRFSSSLPLAAHIDVAIFESADWSPAVLVGGAARRRDGRRLGYRRVEDACEAMGLPRDFTKEMPFTMHGKRSVIGNGVPMAMGRAIAKAVWRATGVIPA